MILKNYTLNNFLFTKISFEFFLTNRSVQALNLNHSWNETFRIIALKKATIHSLLKAKPRPLLFYVPHLLQK